MKIQISLILIILAITVAADNCNNTYSIIQVPTSELTDPAFAAGTSASSDDINVEDIDTPAAENSVITPRPSQCWQGNPFQTGGIAWTVTDPDVYISYKIVRTWDGFIVTTGYRKWNRDQIYLTFINPMGITEYAYKIDFPTNQDTDLDIAPADSSDQGAIVLGVTNRASKCAFAGYYTFTGRQWENALNFSGLEGDGWLKDPYVYSTNGKMEFGFMYDHDNDTAFDYSYNLSTGNEDRGVILNATDENVWLEAVYQDTDGDAILQCYTNYSESGAELKLIRVSGTSTKDYEVQATTDGCWWPSALLQSRNIGIKDCGTDICFSSYCTQYNRIFRASPATGTVARELQFNVNQTMFDVEPQGDNFYVVGYGLDTDLPFATLADFNGETINWHQYYNIPGTGNPWYTAIAPGTNTMAIAGSNNIGMVITLASKTTGQNQVTTQILVNTGLSQFNWPDIISGSDTYYFTGTDRTLDGTGGQFTGKLQFYEDPTVPEFSLGTLLIAILLAGTAIIAVQKFKY